MGNKLGENTGASLMDQIQKQYEKVKQDQRGLVLLHKETQNNFLFKEYTFCSQSQFEYKKKELDQQIKSGPKQYVVSPMRVQSNIFSSFCSTSYKIYAIFEYPQVTLKQEITARQRQSKNFQQTELWSILQSCASALSDLKPLVSLNSNQIFINPDGQLKIIHDDLIDQNYRAVLTDQVYYAPQKLKNFNKLDTQLGLRKESIFSMGMTLLQAAMLNTVNACYDYTSCSFSESILSEMLEQLTYRYSPQFIEMLSNITEVNPNRRASLMEIQKVLDNFWGAEESKYQQQNKQEERNNLIISTNKQTKVLQTKQDPPLTQKCFNSQPINKEEKQRTSVDKNFKAKERQITIPNELSSYKLQKPKQQEDFFQVITPKNQINSKQSNLYTDPKLLQMIKKDLEDISKLKQSAFCEQSKYTYMYPQTQSILNSIKNFETESKPIFTQSITNQIQPFSSTQPLEFQQKQPSFTRKADNQTFDRPMMKNNQNQLIFIVQTYQDGRKYEGTTLNGKKHGKGKLLFQDGAYYQGEFKQDKMNGNGTLYYAQNSPAYKGEWKNDQFQGKGILYNQNPQPLNEGYDFSNMNEVQEYWVKYQGEFNMDNKSGSGKLYLTNGQIFEGQFWDDCVNGLGRYHCINGEIVDGIWKENMLTEITSSQ